MAIKIHSLHTSLGFLKNSPIELADDLTCIIGARGTCKSTVVETIRFVFDCDRERVDQVLLAETSRTTPGGETARERPSAGHSRGRQRLLRNRRDDGIGRRQADHRARCPLAAAPVPEGVKGLSDVALLDQIEIYSQGDLQRFAESDSLRLELIDRPNKTAISDLKRRRKEQADALGAIGPALRQKRAEVETRRSKVQMLAS